MTWDIEHAMGQVRTPVGFVLAATAGIGVILAAHWPLPMAVMVLLCALTLVAPELARRSSVWFAVTAVWAIAVIVYRSEMEDHVYLWLAWTLAVGLSLLDRGNFIQEVARHGRLLIGLVFGVATLWKLTSGSFLSGAALWTLGLHDSRMAPLFRLAGINQESFDAARPAVRDVAVGDAASFEIVLSEYSTVAIIALSIGTIALEALVAVTHLVPRTNKLARLQIPAVVVFGLVTYSIVPVLGFAALLAVISATVADFERRAMIALTIMVAIAGARLFTL